MHSFPETITAQVSWEIHMDELRMKIPEFHGQLNSIFEAINIVPVLAGPKRYEFETARESAKLCSAHISRIEVRIFIGLNVFLFVKLDCLAESRFPMDLLIEYYL